LIIPEDLKELADSIFHDMISEKGGVHSTNENITKYGRRITCDWYNTTLKDVDGKGTGMELSVEKSFSTEQISNSNIKIQTGTEQILLVDDEEAILSMKKQMLERLGYQVTSSISSIEAFRAAPNKFDLVITDLAMPNMPGNKLSAELIKIRFDIPVLLCTGFSETMSEEKAGNSLFLRPTTLRPEENNKTPKRKSPG
jgi:CheY-like chemotaxis protein